MSDHGISYYEAKDIADTAAERAANEARSAAEYYADQQIRSLQDQINDLREAINDLREQARETAAV